MVFAGIADQTKRNRIMGWRTCGVLRQTDFKAMS
jgi:hypothetical protein